MASFDTSMREPPPGSARRRAAFAAAFAALACASSHAGGVADRFQSLERCWYVVEETVVPVNLPRVLIDVSPAPGFAMRRVRFRDSAKPAGLITEVVVSADRAHELLEALAQRRNECAGASR